MSEETPYVLSRLKELDPERYLACLYLPSVYRRDVASIWAFDAEISQIPVLVSEPMPGEIRLQWWRDLIKSGGNADSGPLADALLYSIDRHDLPRETFDNYLEARIFDLYQDPMPDSGTYEGYLGETVAILLQNVAQCIGAHRTTLLADASGHAGMAIGTMRLISGMKQARAKQQLFFPLDILEKHGLNRDTWLGEEIFEEHFLVIDELCRLAQYHLTFTREIIEQLPKSIHGAFLPLALVEPMLKLVKKNRLSVFETRIALSPLKRQFALFTASARGRF